MKQYKLKRGRPTGTCRIRITPEFRERPDVEKLGKALIAIVVKAAETKKADDVSGEGDAMT